MNFSNQIQISIYLLLNIFLILIILSVGETQFQSLLRRVITANRSKSVRAVVRYRHTSLHNIFCKTIVQAVIVDYIITYLDQCRNGCARVFNCNPQTYLINTVACRGGVYAITSVNVHSTQRRKRLKDFNLIN
jgi:hypothetical protein